MTGMRSPTLGNPDLVNHSGFILAEDEALKNYLTGMQVPTRPGESAMTDVGVWFRYPEGERNIKFPFVTIDLLDVAPAYDLWTSEYVMDVADLYQPSVSPTMPEPLVSMGLDVRNYLAFRLTYQVSVHSRSSLHDRFLMSRFFTDVFPPRPFWMGVDADNTWRRVELVDTAQSDLMETSESGNKRIFRKVYTISMMAEIPQDEIRQAWKVLRVYATLYDQETLDLFFTPEHPVAQAPDLESVLPTSAGASSAGFDALFVNPPYALSASGTGIGFDAVVGIRPVATDASGSGSSFAAAVPITGIDASGTGTAYTAATNVSTTAIDAAGFSFAFVVSTGTS